MRVYRLTLIIILLISGSLSGLAQHTEPVPIMGQKSVKTFLKYHIDYPEEELKNNIQGTVGIDFTTNEYGKVVDYHISKSVSPKLDSSAISILKLILWKPATYNGRAVKETSNFEIKYNIKSFQKLSRKRGYKHILLPSTPVDTSGTIFYLKQVDTIPKAILELGYKTVADFIYSKLTYPDAALKLGLEGEVKVSFIIETNGLPSNIIAEKHLGAGCTEEAIKIIETIKWMPGLKENKAVRTRYMLSVIFKKPENRDGHIPNQSGSGI